MGVFTARGLLREPLTAQPAVVSTDDVMGLAWPVLGGVGCHTGSRHHHWGMDHHQPCSHTVRLPPCVAMPVLGH